MSYGEKNDAHLSIRIPESLKSKLEWLAKQDRRDFSDYLRIFYEDLTKDVPDDFRKKWGKVKKSDKTYNGTDERINMRLPKSLREKLEWLSSFTEYDLFDYVRLQYEKLVGNVPDDFMDRNK
jgi:predicted DNA-binding protein